MKERLWIFVIFDDFMLATQTRLSLSLCTCRCFVTHDMSSCSSSVSWICVVLWLLCALVLGVKCGKLDESAFVVVDVMATTHTEAVTCQQSNGL
jgi:hypothetical protein